MAFLLSSNPKQILKKIKSFSHGEFNHKEINEEEIQKNTSK